MLLPVPPQLGYPVLAALVFGESAGLPVPGETALITASGLAASGHLALPAVIAIAAGAAITGDTLGYLLGRSGGRSLLMRGGIGAAHRRNAVQRADRFFGRFGTTAVFFARWIPGVRVVAALMAGTTRMPWRRFAVANALGAVAWASTVAMTASLLGTSGALLLAACGLAGGTIAGTAAALCRRRNAREQTAAPRSCSPVRAA